MFGLTVISLIKVDEQGRLLPFCTDIPRQLGYHRLTKANIIPDFCVIHKAHRDADGNPSCFLHGSCLADFWGLLHGIGDLYQNDALQQRH